MRLPESERAQINEKVTALRQSLQGDDIQRINQLSAELQNVLHALSQQASADQNSQAGHNGNGHTPGKDEEGEVIEGQFHEI